MAALMLFARCEDFAKDGYLNQTEADRGHDHQWRPVREGQSRDQLKNEPYDNCEQSEKDYPEHGLRQLLPGNRARTRGSFHLHLLDFAKWWPQFT